MRKLILCCAALLLTSCATTDAVQPLAHTDTVTVNVPVPVQCVDAADVPAVPKCTLRQDGDTAQLAAGAGACIYALRAYAAKADVLLRACEKSQPEEKPK